MKEELESQGELRVSQEVCDQRMSERKIKFRVWDSKNKSWIHGPGDEVNLFGETILLGAFMPVSLERLNDMIPLQFIGLLDKNGREIYDGDIVSALCNIITPFKGRVPIFYGIHVIGWYDEDSRWSLKQPWKKEGFEPDYVISKDGWTLEVIGNIYENPELLK